MTNLQKTLERLKKIRVDLEEIMDTDWVLASKKFNEEGLKQGAETQRWAPSCYVENVKADCAVRREMREGTAGGQVHVDSLCEHDMKMCPHCGVLECTKCPHVLPRVQVFPTSPPAESWTRERIRDFDELKRRVDRILERRPILEKGTTVPKSGTKDTETIIAAPTPKAPPCTDPAWQRAPGDPKECEHEPRFRVVFKIDIGVADYLSGEMILTQGEFVIPQPPEGK